MNDEERQRQMDFILSQQAQFATDIQRLGEAQARTEESLGKTNEAIGRAVDVLNRLAEVTIVGFQELRENIAALNSKHAEMDERLNKMIIVVERHISEGYHGRSQKE